MTIVATDRLSDSPYVEMVSEGYTLSAGSTIRPSEIHWHMVIMKICGKPQLLVVGPLTSSGLVEWGEGGEIVWIKLKLGTYFPHLPPRNFIDVETPRPGASSNSFWLKGSAWQYPDFNNVETFIDRLVREDILVSDPVIHAALNDQLPETPSRTIRHRFQYATGLSQTHIRQYERAQQAAALLEHGVSILDTVDMMGYFDQPHLTRSLRRFIGKTPAQLYVTPASCHSVQDTRLQSDYYKVVESL
jgi:AraC-like DNA-binding protein